MKEPEIYKDMLASTYYVVDRLKFLVQDYHLTLKIKVDQGGGFQIEADASLPVLAEIL